MGHVYRKTYTMPLPPEAEVSQRDGDTRTARWRLQSGKLRTGEVVEGRNGELRIRGRSPHYTARYYDADGQMVEVSTGCRDETAARSILAQLERRVELIKAGVMTDAESEAANHSKVPLARHIDAYIQHLKARNCARRRIEGVKRRLTRVCDECRFTRLAKLDATALEHWLVDRREEGMAAATLNTYREAAVCFGNWCRRTRRLTHNPFEDVPKADANVDRRHQRRALTEIELQRLLHVARWRPLAEYGREKVTLDERPANRRSRRTWKRADLTFDTIEAAVARAKHALRGNPDFIAELEHRGRERALIYRTLVLTGLRKGELASLTVGQLELDAPGGAYAILNAKDEKNRRGSEIPLRGDLADDLRRWLDNRLATMQRDASVCGGSIPARLPHNLTLFDIPTGLTRILDRDLKTAGIPKRDERDRVIDVHAFRHTFGTHLCAAGVPLRIAQAAMRHSKPELTANIYTDPKLLDVAGALNALPAFDADHVAAKGLSD